MAQHIGNIEVMVGKLFQSLSVWHRSFLVSKVKAGMSGWAGHHSWMRWDRGRTGIEKTGDGRFRLVSQDAAKSKLKNAASSRGHEQKLPVPPGLHFPTSLLPLASMPPQQRYPRSRESNHITTLPLELLLEITSYL